MVTNPTGRLGLVPVASSVPNREMSRPGFRARLAMVKKARKTTMSSGFLSNSATISGK